MPSDLADLGAVAYVDSSALIKLVVPEAESEPLRRELARWDRHASSALVRTEVFRAVLQADPAARQDALTVVRALTLIAVSNEILDRAALLEPSTLRSLDALHLASALSLGAALGSLVTYDQRLGAAARAAGLDVRAPI